MVGILLNRYDILLGEVFELPISWKKDFEHPSLVALPGLSDFKIAIMRMWSFNQEGAAAGGCGIC
ncbi:hypothetical protein H5410_049768 [Solanum commersonii]|uniref:Uncharacterized protein n=1 Tax=Solanum commersonii TaxID=4109 RepID=A0A9J5WV49_SOLCO|nr:hypothetical protein H5410_049768 [Solanum commersonii]